MWGDTGGRGGRGGKGRGMRLENGRTLSIVMTLLKDPLATSMTAGSLLRSPAGREGDSMQKSRKVC